MAPKKSLEPVAGQRSIQSFFASKSKPVSEPIATNLNSEPPRGAAAAAAVINPSFAIPVPVATAAAPKPAADTTVKQPAQQTDPAAVIGNGIRVYWKDDETWYRGRISKFDASNGKHLVEYDDGDAEWINIGEEKVEMLSTWKPKKNKSTSGKTAAAAAKRKRATVVLDSDEDEDEGAAGGGGAKDASGSEYGASSEDDASEDSLDLEEEVESDDDDDDDVMEIDIDEEFDLGGGGDDDDDDASPSTKKKTAAATTTTNNKSKKKKKFAKTTPAPATTTTTKKSIGGEAPLTSGATTAKTPGIALNNGMSITPYSTGNTSKKSIGSTQTTVVVQKNRPAAGHIPASSSAMRSALDRSPTATTAGTILSPGGGGGGGSSNLAEAAAASASDISRFSARDAARFPFLHPEKIRDAARRRPGDPGYNPTTLYIPPDWFKQQKVSEGQRQWWEFKAGNWGSILLFKVGKFYEIFEMDAHIGAECLGLSYMKGDQPHCGFPEAGYAAMAERLARAGHRVVVIEQTETPDALARRNEDRKRQGLKKDGVVRREKVAVLTRGTLTDAEMMASVPDAQYLLSVAELPLEEALNGDGGGSDEEMNGSSSSSREKVWIGAAAVDVATGQLLIGQWRDDELRSQLRAVLTALSPVEVILPRDELSTPSKRVVLGVLRCPIVNELPMGTADGHFWTADEMWKRLLEPFVHQEDDGDDNDARGYFVSGKIPEILEEMEKNRADNAAAATALGGCVSYLKDALLDRRVLGAGRVEALEQAVGIGGGGKSGKENGDGGGKMPSFMALDGPALENLEIMENSESGIVGTLLAALDHCTTPFGRRRLRQWLCRPLCRVEDIVCRQDAVQDLMGAAEEAAGVARKALSGVSDLERALARLGATGAGVGCARDAPKVVLYEDVSKKRVLAFIGTLKALKKVQQAIAAFSSCSSDISSSYLLDLVTPGRGRFSDMQAALDEMEAAADWEEAEASGRVVPAAGVDAEYDAAVAGVAAAEEALGEYLKELKVELGSRDVRYTSLNKDSHVIEVPEDLSVPRTWESMQGKKGVKRYTTADLKPLVAARETALDTKETAQSGILRAILTRFAEKRDVWSGAVDSVAILDALMSLAVAAACSAGTMVRPTILPWSPDAPPLFKARGLRHPAGVGGSGSAIVPNDVLLGGDQNPPFIVLTGPNMGGKSTLMRQVCLAAVAAQIGAWLPAEEVELTPADAVFVRMGARDRIMLGQSTFFVELSETAAALASATRYSIVALDELGRGTATTDGAAIAAAVLDHLAASVQCRGVFATHYHHISDSHVNDPAVAIKHMACAITPAAEADGVDEVTFLYRLTEGACPKSYGVNVARLAGLPESVVRRAAVASQQAESRGIAGLRDAPLGTAVDHHGVAMEIDGSPDDGVDVEVLRQKVIAACKLALSGDNDEGGEMAVARSEVQRALT